MASVQRTFHTLVSDTRLYLLLIRMQVRAQTQYKINLVIDITTFLLTTGFEFVGVLLFFAQFPTMLGWKIGEVALLAAVMSISFGLAEMVGAGIDEFSMTIRRGEFDRVLLRPVDVFTQVIGSDFRLRRLGRLIQGTLAFALAMHLLPELHWTAEKLIVLPLGIVTTPLGLETQGLLRKPSGRLKAQSEPQNVEGSVMIAIEYGPAMDARMRALTEVFMWPFSLAGAALLAGLVRVHKQDGRMPGALSLGTHHLCECCPPSILYRLVQPTLRGCSVGQEFACFGLGRLLMFLGFKSSKIIVS